MIKIGEYVKITYDRFYLILKITAVSNTIDFEQNRTLGGIVCKTSDDRCCCDVGMVYNSFFAYKKCERLNRDEYFVEML